MPHIENNTALITLGEWLTAGLTYNQYEHDKNRYFLRSTRGCKGTEVQIEWDSILEKRKAILRAKYGDPSPKKEESIDDVVRPDPEAFTYYSDYRLNDGRDLPAEALTEYCANAAVLNAISKVVGDSINMRRAQCNSVRIYEVWNNVTKAVAHIDRERWKHTLPENSRRLRDKHAQYLREGYLALVHRNFCNQSARKVSKQMEDLFIALYTTKNRHFTKTVRDLYLSFLSGDIEVANVKTGEIFDRIEFFTPEGTPLFISESTTWSYLSKPVNRQVINKFRSSAIDHKTKDLPYNHRHKPDFTLSKVSFDDRDLPRRTAKGFEGKAYYAYEPLSGCFIGWSHSRTKDTELVIDCFRSMLQFLLNNNMPWPAEAEVENHIMSQLKELLYGVFPYVRFCNPGNSREKRAEHGIKQKKYGAEKLLQENIGRWRNRHDAYNINQDDNRTYEFDELVADDIASIHFNNNEKHPSFPGKTRLQVLREKANPALLAPQLHKILKFLGNRTETSIRNFDFVRVQHKKYAIDTDKVLGMLSPNNFEVEAYWLPGENGSISDVYLYQGEKYLCKADLIETYNEAQAERTDRDEEIRTDQAKRQAHARKRIKDRAATIPRIEVIRSTVDYSEIVPEILDVSPEGSENTNENFDFDNIIADADYWKELGKASI